MITDYRSCSLFNSPCQHPGKCIENSKENMHTDVSVLRVKYATEPTILKMHWSKGQHSGLNVKRSGLATWLNLVLRSWIRHFTMTMPPFTQEFEWVTANSVTFREA